MMAEYLSYLDLHQVTKGKIRGRGWLLFFVDFFHKTCKRHLFIPNDVL